MRRRLEALYKKNILIINLLIFSFILMWLVNFFVENKIAFLAGESQYSFDYAGHIQNLVTEIIDDNKFLELNDCKGCPVFYGYSRWVALLTMVMSYPGEVLRINSFIYYLFLTIITQLLSLYIFSKVFFKKVNVVAYLISSIFFIILPSKFLILGYAVAFVWYVLAITTITFLYYIFINLKLISMKRLSFLSVAIGVVLSFWLSLGIGFIPFGIYSSAIVALLKIKRIITYYIKSITFFLTVLATVIILNLPFVISIIKNGNRRTFSDYIPLSFLEAVTGRVYFSNSSLENIPSYLVIILFVTLLFLLIQSEIKTKYKAMIVSSYALLTVSMMKTPIYDFIFRNIPFMSSMRDIQRLGFYQHIILYMVAYLGLTATINKKRWLSKVLVFGCTIILIGVPAQFISKNLNYINIVKVPNDYFQVDSYLSHSDELKVYFPFTTPALTNLLGNYTWAPDLPKFRSTWVNPYLSIFSLPKLEHAENYPLATDYFQNELRSLLDYNHNPNDIIKALELRGIKYLIFDGNYRWRDYYPSFNTTQLTQNLTLDRRFGYIYIYKLSDRSKDCKRSFGDYKIGYCVDLSMYPDYLVNRTVDDYLLDRVSPDLENMTKNTKGVYPYFIDHHISDAFARSGIGIPFLRYHISEAVDSVYKKTLQKGDYIFSIPVLQISQDLISPNEAYLVIQLNNEIIGRISSYDMQNQYKRLYQVIKINDVSEITVSTVGKGSSIIGAPTILTVEEWNKIQTKASGYNPQIISNVLK